MISFTVPQVLAEYADAFAFRLWEYKEKTNARDNNNLKATAEERLHLHRRGKRGEAGLYFFFGGKAAGARWNTTIGRGDYSNVSDISFCDVEYDAKAIDRHSLSLCIYPKSVHEHWRYVLVCVKDWPAVDLIGWCTGADVLTTQIKEKVADRPAYFIEQGNYLLRNCESLKRKAIDNPLFGYCRCGNAGLYLIETEEGQIWSCNTHRQI
jgi:hypothetical protein